MDLDGLIERRGRFLVIETKLPGVPIPVGQEITLKALMNTGWMTVLVIWGHPGRPEMCELWHEQRVYAYDPCNIDKLRAIVSRWYAWADAALDVANITLPAQRG